MFFLLLVTARAQTSADDQYLAIYGVILQADNLAGSGQNAGALTAYKDALARLQQFHNQLPDWKPDIINYRLSDLTGKITSLQSLVPAVQTQMAANTNIPAAGLPSVQPPVDPQMQQLQAQLQSARNENAELQAKLKAAFAVQPAAVDGGELTKAQEQIRSLMKENDLLKASEDSAPKTEVIKVPESKTSDSVKVLKREVETLRARIAVDEAKAVPYSDEELALLRQNPQPVTPPAVAPTVTAVSPAKPSADTIALMAAAQQDFADHKLDLAEADYQKILQNDPNNNEVLGNLAAIELNENKLDAADKNIQTALTQNPQDDYNLAMAGKIKFAQGKYDEALDYLSRSAAIQPKNPETQNYLGLVLSRKGLRPQAETAFRKAIQIYPDYAPAHSNLAAFYLTENPPMPQLALWHYRKAIAAGESRNPDLEKLLAEKGAPFFAP